ncbi:MAG TPA: DUF5666 domain-containing protein [Candidatus Acidoferrum sp.]|nr:DUF5666 domain-containing protein [Candidatus Acidoferrum sp.]
MATPVAPVGSVPMSITIGDTPPNGVAVLFFETLITGASLQPSESSKPAVSVLQTPVEVEFGHLQTDTAFLSLANVTPGTYSGLTLTFGTAAITIVNHSGAAIGSCANNSVCELSPKFNPSTAMVSGTSFPLTISDNSMVGMQLDFNVNSSVQSDLSINPTVTIKHLMQRQDVDKDKEMEEVDEVEGQVTAVGSNQFTLMNERSGQSFTISVDMNTQFEDFDRTGCTANPADITCVKTGQILNVDLSGSGSGTMLAKRVEFEEDANKRSIKGTITSVDSATQFQIVVFNEEPTVSGVSEGSLVVVTIQPNAMFQVGREELGENGGFTIAGLNFGSSADLLVGQDVQIRPGMVSSSGGVTNVTTDLVRLWPSQITGQVASIGAGNSTFTLNGLSPLFTGATTPITTINVVVLSEMRLMDDSGSGSLAMGQTVSVKGLLFNTMGTPTVVTRTLREHHGD